MEQKVNNNSVIIEDNRVDLTPYLGNLDEESFVISWKALGFTAKPVVGQIIFGENGMKYAVLPKSKKYAARFPNKPLYTNEEGLSFVSLILCRSNFAKANKVLFVLFRDGNKPCGVITEEF